MANNTADGQRLKRIGGRMSTAVEKYLNENGEEVVEELEEMWARAFQHEFDHIEGILFTDRLSILNKRLVAKKLDVLKKDFAKGRIYRDLD